MRINEQKMQIVEAQFCTNKYLTVCSKKNVHVYGLQPIQSIVSISGGPFVHSVYSKQFLFAVSDSNTPPYTLSFLLIYKNGALLRSIEFNSNILSIRSSESYVFVSLESTIQVLEIDTFNLVSTIERPSKSGLLACSEQYVSYTNDEHPGYVTICIIPGFSVIQNIQCHKDPITMLSFSEDSKLFITASTVGTLVRIFNIESGRKLDEYRRGFTQSSIIAAAANDLMACAISPSTLHVFLGDSQHITTRMSSTPLNCCTMRSSVAVIDVNGILTIYKVDGLNGTAQMVTQYRILSATLSDDHQKKTKNLLV